MFLEKNLKLNTFTIKKFLKSLEIVKLPARPALWCTLPEAKL